MLVDSDVLIWYLRGLQKAAQFLDTLPALRLLLNISIDGSRESIARSSNEATFFLSLGIL